MYNLIPSISNKILVFCYFNSLKKYKNIKLEYILNWMETLIIINSIHAVYISMPISRFITLLW